MLTYVAILCIFVECSGGVMLALEPSRTTQSQQPAVASKASDGNSVIHLPYAQFHIPFNIDHSGTQPASVQLYVSTDGGSNWQLHGSHAATARHFEFRAAAEGEYLFTVHTVDSAGVAFPSPNAPLRVMVDTTKPQSSIQAELDHNGSLIVDITAFDPNLNLESGKLQVRTDRDSSWREVAVDQLDPVGDHYEGQVELILPPCREVLMIFSIADLAKNSSEASFRYMMPRTAVGQSDMQLASGRSGINAPDFNGSHVNSSSFSPSAFSIPGAVLWDAEAERQFAARSTATQSPLASPTTTSLKATAQNATAQNATAQNASSIGTFPTSPVQTTGNNKSNESIGGSGRLAGNRFDVKLKPGQNLELPNRHNEIEELPTPQKVETDNTNDYVKLEIDQATSNQPNLPSSNAVNSPASDYTTSGSEANLNSESVGSDAPYYCKSRTFSLDYSVDTLAGNLLSEVELWGTEDNGSTWQKWGTDPDRNSPFDVRVGNDGLFGFRMVSVGQGGYVLGQPKSGEPADVWIHVDTELPACKITRAVYGEGSEAGMLVIDYTCLDSQLADNPITLSYSTNPQGPWTPFASGTRNSGLYLWKVEPNVPNRVYLKLEAVDKAGNTGEHRMELPINIKGLSPRGRIQGFRPIFED